MAAKVFLATHHKGLSRAQFAQGDWAIASAFQDQVVHCLAVDPLNPDVVLAGTRGQGVFRSTDRGCTWHPCGLQGTVVKSVAASRTQPGLIYAGTMPPCVYVSHDSGEHWSELDAFRRIPSRWWWRSPAEASLAGYVQGIALSPTQPDLILVGVEAGAVVRSQDGGRTWSDHRPGALRDCHSITFHASNGDWVYEAGGTGAGVAFSRDGGKTWRQPRQGLDRTYGWACAADPARPEVWYVSASPQFDWSSPGVPPAHHDGQANAFIFRSVGGAAWQKLGGGLPQPLDYMAYALLTDPGAPGHVYAGLSNGDIWHSADHGDSWTQLPFKVKGIHRTLIII